MRMAVINTLDALFTGKEVTASKCLEFNTTRITNEISILRNDLKIDIITDRVNAKDTKWYGSYRLIRSKDNLERVKKILETYSNDKNLISAKKVDSDEINKVS